MKIAVSLLLSAAVLLPLPGKAKTIDMAAFRQLARISSPAVSPDGRRIAFLKTAQDFAGDKNLTTLEVVDVASGAMHALTKPATDLSSPHWSPRGDRIAYIAAGKNKQDQIFAVAAGGGAPQEITSAKNGVEQFSWSPDGRHFAYVTPDDPPNTAALKRHDDLFDIHDDGYRTDSPAVSSHIWIVASNGGGARRLTHGSWSVLEAAPPFVGAASNPSWSRDGKQIAFTLQADADDSDTDMTKIAIVNVATGGVRMLTDHEKYEYQPQFSPADGSVQYIYPHGPGPVSVMNVYVNGDNISSGLDMDISEAQWMPDGKGVIGMADDRTGVGLWQQPVRGGARRIDLGNLNVEDFDVGASGAIAIVASNADVPQELYYLATTTVRPVKITSLNQRFLNYTYGKSTEFSWTGADGERSDGILTYPVGYVSGRKYPLVVYSHGGPEGASSQTFDGGEIGHLRYGFSTNGYIVFEPNYRGSDNLGNAHEHGIFRNPGTGPGDDVMAGIAALEKTGSIDTSRIAAVGHSYGGYMTTWLIGHSQIWRVAVVADGAVDWREEYDLAAAGNLAWTRDSLGGTPMDPQAAPLYTSGSPIAYAGSITAPTLILSGTSDQTVPISESFELYHALRDRGVPVRFVGLPGAYHSPSRPVQVDQYYQDILDWVNAHMR